MLEALSAYAAPLCGLAVCVLIARSAWRKGKRRRARPSDERREGADGAFTPWGQGDHLRRRRDEDGG